MATTTEDLYGLSLRSIENRSLSPHFILDKSCSTEIASQSLRNSESKSHKSLQKSLSLMHQPSILKIIHQRSSQPAPVRGYKRSASSLQLKIKLPDRSNDSQEESHQQIKIEREADKSRFLQSTNERTNLSELRKRLSESLFCKKGSAILRPQLSVKKSFFESDNRHLVLNSPSFKNSFRTPTQRKGFSLIQSTRALDLKGSQINHSHNIEVGEIKISKRLWISPLD